jgi:hypothetical protein
LQCIVKKGPKPGKKPTQKKIPRVGGGKQDKRKTKKRKYERERKKNMNWRTQIPTPHPFLKTNTPQPMEQLRWTVPLSLKISYRYHLL